MRCGLFLVVAFAACGSAQGSRTEAPRIVNGRLAVGPRPALGCFAWSPTEHAAACITGTAEVREPEVAMAFLDGHTTEIPLFASIDARVVKQVNDELVARKFEALTATARPLAIGETIPIGRAKLSFRARPSPEPGKPRTRMFQVYSICGSDESNVLGVDLDDGGMAVAIRQIGDRAIVEVTMKYVHLAENPTSFSALVFDAGACSVRGAIPVESR